MLFFFIFYLFSMLNIYKFFVAVTSDDLNLTTRFTYAFIKVR